MSLRYCPDCNGCADGRCRGCDKPRWCGGAFLGIGCTRCPYTVLVPVPGTRSAERQPCTLNFNHGGDCRPAERN